MWWILHMLWSVTAHNLLKYRHLDEKNISDTLACGSCATFFLFTTFRLCAKQMQGNMSYHSDEKSLKEATSSVYKMTQHSTQYMYLNITYFLINQYIKATASSTSPACALSCIKERHVQYITLYYNMVNHSKPIIFFSGRVRSVSKLKYHSEEQESLSSIPTGWINTQGL